MTVRVAPSILRTGLAALLTSAALFGAFAPAAAQAPTASSRTGDRNVYAGGGQVRPAGAVEGDFAAAAGKVVVDQPVGGDASLAGGSVDVRAPVGDDVRAVGGDVTIESTVGGELFATGGNISLARAASVARSATLYGSSVEIDGRVDGDLRATARKVTIDGEVRGNVRLVAEEIELGPTARIGGTLTYASASELKKAEGATVAGAVTREQQAPRGDERARTGQWEKSVQVPSWGGGILSFLALLAAGAMFLLLLPRFAVTASQRIQSSPWLALGIGFGTVVAIPFLAVLLFITILGIPLGIALFALYPALMLGGFVVGVLFIARRLAAALRKQEPASFRETIGYFAAALLLTLLVGMVPAIGGFVVGLVSLAGIGAVVVELHGRRKGRTGGGATAVTVEPDQVAPVPRG